MNARMDNPDLCARMSKKYISIAYAASIVEARWIFKPLHLDVLVHQKYVHRPNKELAI